MNQRRKTTITPTWRWRHQRLDGVRPEVGDVVWSVLTPKRRFKVVERRKDGRNWAYVVDDGNGLIVTWKWSKGKATAREDGQSGPSTEPDLFDGGTSPNDTQPQVKVSGRNDFCGYMFERVCTEQPHPKAKIVESPLPYRPSTSDEGFAFEEQYCTKCRRNENDPDDPCGILMLVSLPVSDPDYPSEWQRIDGVPTCTAFVAKESP